MPGMVKVWAGADRELQHLTAEPADDTTREWRGATLCNLDGDLHWVPPEIVDRAKACAACADIGGTAPPLAGQGMTAP
jgi:hypothetical protein